jgi:hypothetical protein
LFVPVFIKGLELNRLFHHTVVAPILKQHFPNLTYAAATMGTGSEVFGFDTEMSRDHDWGPGIILFLQDDDIQQSVSIKEVFREALPNKFMGHPTRFAASSTESDTLAMSSKGKHHRIGVTTLKEFIQNHLDFDVDTALTPADWLSFPSQRLRGIVDGALYHDDTGELTALRQKFRWYPHDVWLYMLAAGWQRVGQEQPLMSRAGFVGDELGSSVIGSRLIRDIVSLCFMMEKKYAPYPKWFGSAFKKLESSATLFPLLEKARQASGWQVREDALNEACEYLARQHNALNISAPIPEEVSSFHNRPFKVIDGERCATIILQSVQDSEVKRVAQKPLIGNIDQWSDNTDMRSFPVWRKQVLKFYK